MIWRAVDNGYGLGRAHTVGGRCLWYLSPHATSIISKVEMPRVARAMVSRSQVSSTITWGFLQLNSSEKFTFRNLMFIIGLSRFDQDLKTCIETALGNI